MTNVTVSTPPAFGGGAEITVDFTYQTDQANAQLGYFVVFSDQCDLRIGGTTGQDVIVGESGINFLKPAGTVSTGRPLMILY